MTSPRILVAADLDRTLIYTTRHCGLSAHGAPEIVCVEHRNGAPLSYLTRTAADLLAELAATAVLVPATTRTADQYARVRLPGRPSRFAVCANGGTLLVDGIVDRGWRTSVRARLLDSVPLSVVRAHLDQVLAPAWVRSRRCVEGLFTYVVLTDREALPAGWLSDLDHWATARGWRVSVLDHKIHLVPARLTKSAAVAEVARRAGTTTLLAAGDSLLDAELLESADAAIRPAHGELAARGWRRPHVAVTRTRGVLAGEEILRWLTTSQNRVLSVT
ncbi:HAD family hydrolase [Streptoalloteichus hindustanus]|uniref:Hydroxymethylpyrimidine pyrophosphatase n=1 Tax=Streptoalloteichus hindustanus TaxID=2017 RepID=A0A1M5D362_STRHI|nr:hypothetical protein [Streptoalloteichus hindustanus]SHF61493.1 hypothetical protein SAMN05444320_104283 [Streptoalloteichus hindustanus]